MHNFKSVFLYSDHNTASPPTTVTIRVAAVVVAVLVVLVATS